MSETTRYLNIQQAAALCSVSRRTITSWLQKGWITKYVAPNGYNVRISEDELLAFDAERRTAPTVPDGGDGGDTPPGGRYLG